METEVPKIVNDVRQRILEGCTFVELLSFVRSGKELTPTPFNLIRILVQAGIDLREVQHLYPFFDEDLHPLHREDCEACWRSVVQPYIDRLAPQNR